MISSFSFYFWWETKFFKQWKSLSSSLPLSFSLSLVSLRFGCSLLSTIPDSNKIGGLGGRRKWLLFFTIFRRKSQIALLVVLVFMMKILSFNNWNLMVVNVYQIVQHLEPHIGSTKCGQRVGGGKNYWKCVDTRYGWSQCFPSRKSWSPLWCFRKYQCPINKGWEAQKISYSLSLFSLSLFSPSSLFSLSFLCFLSFLSFLSLRFVCPLLSTTPDSNKIGDWEGDGSS